MCINPIKRVMKTDNFNVSVENIISLSEYGVSVRLYSYVLYNLHANGKFKKNLYFTDSYNIGTGEGSPRGEAMFVDKKELFGGNQLKSEGYCWCDKCCCCN